MYLLEHCIPVSSADTRRHLRSANRHLLAVPRFRLNTYGRWAFSAAGPMAWYSLPDFIRDPMSSTDCFRCLLSSALGVLNNYVLYKSTHSLTHSLTVSFTQWADQRCQWADFTVGNVQVDALVSWLLMLVSWHVSKMSTKWSHHDITVPSGRCCRLPETWHNTVMKTGLHLYSLDAWCVTVTHGKVKFTDYDCRHSYSLEWTHCYNAGCI